MKSPWGGYMARDRREREYEPRGGKERKEYTPDVVTKIYYKEFREVWDKLLKQYPLGGNDIVKTQKNWRDALSELLTQQFLPQKSTGLFAGFSRLFSRSLGSQVVSLAYEIQNQLLEKIEGQFSNSPETFLKYLMQVLQEQTKESEGLGNLVKQDSNNRNQSEAASAERLSALIKFMVLRTEEVERTRIFLERTMSPNLGAGAGAGTDVVSENKTPKKKGPGG